MKKIGLVVLLFITLLGKGVFAQDPSTAPVGQVPASVPQVPAGNDLYPQALQAYLAGNYDQAILLDSRALQADPKDAKAQALLSILVSEKDKASQSVIWIGKENGGEPVPVSLPAPVTVTQEKTEAVPVSKRPARKVLAMAELEARVNAVAFLLERDQNSQYRELKGAQVSAQKRLDEISSRSLLGNILLLLALLVAVAALWKSWQNGEEMRRRMSLIGREYEKDGRVVQMRKM